ncbi:MAG TPA: poly-beta-1,6-N-acetyl-D-glucosamine biosynthesis protein PgaD [Variovorax sp.]|nr:poly-beta-1,6-N-acetyl-D-glucosamine biosynthesis protein PgaD [Variovorax sp.]
MHPEPPNPRDLRDTGSAPVLGPPPHWPPRIPRSRAPWWMRARDLVLTIVAWLVFLWILREFVVVAIAWLSPAMGARLKQVVDIGFNVDLRPFLWIAAGLVASLAVIGVLRRHYLRQQPLAENTVQALPPEEQFEAAGVPVSQLAQWQGARCLHVQHGQDGRISGVTTPGV